jgi:membrane fusion protein (multidrug efflux system)
MEEQPKQKNNRRIILISIVLVIAAFGVGLYYYINNSKHETTDNAQLDGTILSVRASVTGFVRVVKFQDNQRVKKGDTLLVIDDKDYRARLEQAKAQLAGAEAQVGIVHSATEAAGKSANASAANAEAMRQNILAAQTRLNKAKSDLARIQNMFKDGAATPQQMDNATTDVATAEAQYALVVEQQKAMQTQAGGAQLSANSQGLQINTTNALIAQRRAEVALAQSQLDNTVILAPFDAIISKKSAEVGQLLQPGQPVCSAVSTTDLWVTANFKETQLAHMKIGQPVDITVDAYNIQIEGTVESFGGATGARFSLMPPDNATGNFVKITQRVPVRIHLEKNQSNDHVLAPGMSTEVDVRIQ